MAAFRDIAVLRKAVQMHTADRTGRKARPVIHSRAVSSMPLAQKAASYRQN